MGVDHTDMVSVHFYDFPVYHSIVLENDSIYDLQSNLDVAVGLIYFASGIKWTVHPKKTFSWKFL